MCSAITCHLLGRPWLAYYNHINMQIILCIDFVIVCFCLLLLFLLLFVKSNGEIKYH